MPAVVPLPTPARGSPAVQARTVPTLLTGAGDRLWLVDLGLACCSVEVTAATHVPMPLLEGLATSPGLGGVDVLVVSGTVTDAMALAVRRLHARLPQPSYVVSFGACSNTGGPYWDSYCVTKGVDQVVPVDVFVPGCPPRPEALIDGLRRLAELIEAGRSRP
jgi:NADH-quinone oxidoreductase subunit B